jgi:ABC-2 type transport system permease protein
MIPIVLGFVVLATGIGMVLSALYVRFRDVQPIWDVFLQAWFYLSPIMYPASAYARFGPHFEHFALINPIATMMTQMGHAFIDPQKLPSALTVGGAGVVALSIALIPAVFALGWFVFTREAPRVAENL